MNNRSEEQLIGSTIKSLRSQRCLYHEIPERLKDNHYQKIFLLQGVKGKERLLYNLKNDRGETFQASNAELELNFFNLNTTTVIFIRKEKKIGQQSSLRQSLMKEKTKLLIQSGKYLIKTIKNKICINEGKGGHSSPYVKKN